MASTDGDLTQLEARLAKGERRNLIRTVAFSIVPVVAAVVFLWFTLQQIESASGRLNEVRAELETAQVELEQAEADLEAAVRTAEAAAEERDEMLALRQVAEEQVQNYVDSAKQLQSRIDGLADESRRYQEQYEEQVKLSQSLAAELAAVSARLDEAVAFEKYAYDLDWADLKSISLRSEDARTLLLQINGYREQGVGWSVENTISRGFSSTGFAAYILRELQVLPSGSSDAALSDLKVVQGPPQLGDLVIYDFLYAMFYMEDGEGTPFVVGMTPTGILALELEFGPKIREFRDTGLSR